jgi:uncharacterized protein
MIKIILLAIAVWLVISIVKRYLKSTGVPSNNPEATTEPVGSESRKSESMVQCTHCGVHLPVDDSLLIDHQYYCCKAHSDAAKTNPPSDDPNHG